MTELEPKGLQEQTIKRPDPTTGTMIGDAYGELEGGLGPVDAWDRWRASAILKANDSPIGVPGLGQDDMISGTYTRYFARKDLERDLQSQGRAKLTPDQANQQFPGLPEPFKDPVYPEVAQIIYDEHKHKEKWREYILRGGGNSAWMELAAGLPTALDPVNLLVSKGLSGVSKALGASESLRASLIENLTGNLLADVPSYTVLKAEQDNPSALGMAIGSLGGAAGGTLIHAAIKFLKVNAEQRMKTMPQGVKDEATRMAIAQQEMGKRVDVTPVLAQADKRLLGVREGGALTGPVTGPVEPGSAPKGVYFAAYDAADQNVALANHGDGLYLTDSQSVAHNMAAPPEELIAGNVVVYRVKEDAKLMDTSARINDTPDFRSKLEQKLGPEISKLLELDGNERLADVMERVRELRQDERITTDPVREVAQELGYQGYREPVKAGNAPDGPALHDRVFLFDPKAAEVMDAFPGTKEGTPRIDSPERAGAAESTLSPERDVHYDEKIREELRTLESEKRSLDTKGVEMVRDMDSYAERVLRSKMEQGKTPAPPNEVTFTPITPDEIQTELKRIEQAAKAEKNKAETFKAFADCITQGLL